MKPAFWTLMIAATLSALIIGGIHLLTKSRVLDNQAAHALQILKTVVPRDKIEIILQPGPKPFYNLYDADQWAGVLFGVSTEQGYNGRIDAWLAVGLQKEILGLQTTYHQETPGLGDFINPSARWNHQFRGQPLARLSLELKLDGGDFDHVTGATVTSRAYTRMLQSGLDHPAVARLIEEHSSD